MWSCGSGFISLGDISRVDTDGEFSLQSVCCYCIFNIVVNITFRLDDISSRRVAALPHLGVRVVNDFTHYWKAF